MGLRAVYGTRRVNRTRVRGNPRGWIRARHGIKEVDCHVNGDEIGREYSNWCMERNWRGTNKTKNNRQGWLSLNGSLAETKKVIL